MNTSVQSFLLESIELGGFNPPKIASLFEPLFRQVGELHDVGYIIEDLVDNILVHEEQFILDTTRTSPFKINPTFLVHSYQELYEPQWLDQFQCEEIIHGHHDPLSDIYILGLLFSSFVWNIDLSQAYELKAFIQNKAAKQLTSKGIHPTLALIALEMTALKRKDRAQNLHELVALLSNFSGSEEFSADVINNEESILSHLSLLQKRLLQLNKNSPFLQYKENHRFINLEQLLNANFLNDLKSSSQSNESISLSGPAATYSTSTFKRNLESIRLKAKNDLKEFGFSNVQLVPLYLQWSPLTAQQEEPVLSPLLFLPVAISTHADTAIKLLDVQAIFNPILAYELKGHFNIQLPKYFDFEQADLSDLLLLLQQALKESFSHIQIELENDQELTPNPLVWKLIKSKKVLGNFNYKKMSLVKDFDAYFEEKTQATLIEALLTNNYKKSKPSVKPFSFISQTHTISPTDASQEKAITQAHFGENFVINGPPGTGKSQTISNIISDQIALGKKVLFISDKVAALEAVKRKLTDGGIGQLASIIHDSQQDKKVFLESLNQAFTHQENEVLHIESIERKRKELLHEYHQHGQVLKSYEQALTSIPEGSETASLQEILTAYLALPQHLSKEQKIADNAQFLTYSFWEKYGGNITSVASAVAKENGLQNTGSKHPIFHLKKDCLLANNAHSLLENNIQQSLQSISTIDSLLIGLNLEHFLTISPKELLSLEDEFRFFDYILKNNLAALFDRNGVSLAVLQEANEESIFLAHRLDKLKNKTAHWSTKPAQNTLHKWIRIAQNNEGNFWGFLNTEYRQLKALFRKNYTKNLLDLPYSYSESLQFLAEAYTLEASIENRQKNMEAHYGAMPLSKLLQNIKLYENSLLVQVLQSTIPIQKNVFELLYTNLNILADHVSCISLEHLQDLEALKSALTTLQVAIPNYTIIQSDLSTLARNSELWEWLQNSNWNAQEIQCIAIKNTLHNFFNQHPEFVNQSGTNLNAATKKIQELKLAILEQNTATILARYNYNFNQLLRKSSLSISGLSQAEKATRSELQEGRKLLENEFKKSRSHLSIRALADSAAMPFIQELKPVWMMSPLSVADALPLTKQLFDILIFDEASQCPLAEAIPALMRAEQLIVVGDNMQMPPSQYFQKSALRSQLLPNTLLEQAENNLDVLHLNWHYRSQNQSLINFNNAAFYQNQLQTLPERRIQIKKFDPIRIQQATQAAFTYKDIFLKPLSYHRLENGVFEERRNLVEAKYIAELVKHLLLAHNDLSIGVIALSKEQEIAIQEALQGMRFFDKNFENLLQEKYDKYPEFDGFILKNLENIQGEERDIIIVSVGYAANPENQFHMNFGPINNKGGEKRLNVLFSRAKKHLLIVSSIPYTAIKNDYNIGAACLKNYLRYAEALSLGNTDEVSNLLHTMTPQSNHTKNTYYPLLIETISKALESKGYETVVNYGSGKFTIPIAVKNKKKSSRFDLAILISVTPDASQDSFHSFAFKPALLKSKKWKVAQIYLQDWLNNSAQVMTQLLQLLEAKEEKEVPFTQETTAVIPYLLSDADLLFTRLEKHDEKAKFWQIAGKLNDIVIQFGNIGAPGKKIIKNYASVAEVIIEKRKLIKQKEQKGYKRV